MSDLKKIIAEIRKEHGAESIMLLGGEERPKIGAIPTGSLALDIALGIGGVPKGRIVEIYGPEGAGKSTLASCIVANAQRDGIAAYIDVEHAFDPTYAERLGVDVSNLLISQPDYGEQALDIVEQLVGNEGISTIVVDSVAALVPKAEIEGEMGDSHVGLQARLMSQAMRKLNGQVHRHNTCLIFINQIRMKIGVAFGNPETTTGGNALKFYSSVRMDIRRIGAIKGENDVPVGNRTKIKVVKNKVAAPYRVCEFDLYYGKGPDRAAEIAEIAVAVGIVEKSGAWMSYNGERYHGVAALRNAVQTQQPLMDELEQKIKAHYRV